MSPRFALPLLALGLFTQCKPSKMADSWTLQSPGQVVTAHVFLDSAGQAAYHILRGDKTVIDTSLLGFSLLDQAPIAGGLEVKKAENRSFTENWETVWGQSKMVANNFNELMLELEA